MKKAKLTLLFLGLLSGAALVSSGVSADIGDAISMTIREDGQFNVICKDGTHEVASVDDIRGGNICGGEQVDNGRSECKHAKLLLEIVKSLPEFSDQVSDVKEFRLVACAENRPSRYRNGNSTYERGTWYYPNGNWAYYSGTWFYPNPNGKWAYRSNGIWYYPNGNTAYFDEIGSLSYPKGNIAYSRKYNYWRYPNGNIATPSGSTECEKMANLIRTTSDESQSGQMRAAKIILCREL